MGKATAGLGGAAPGASAEPLDGRDDRLISLSGRSPVLDAAQLGILRGYGSETGDPGLRTALFVAANLARQTDPALAAKDRRLVVGRKLHPNSAVCYLAAVLATRIVACLRAGTPIRSADSTDKPSPAPKAESSAQRTAPPRPPAESGPGDIRGRSAPHRLTRQTSLNTT